MGAARRRTRTATRALPALAGLGLARLRRRAGWTAAAIGGMAAATVLLVGGLLWSQLAQDAALEARLTAIAPQDAGVRIRVAGSVQTGGADVPVEDRRELDAAVRGVLADPDSTLAAPERAVAFADQRGPAGAVALVAVADLRTWTRLTGGRRPQPCTGGGAGAAEAATCEALVLGGARPRGTVSYGGLGLRVVGSAALSPAPAGPVPPPRGSLGAGATWLAVDGLAVADGGVLDDRARAYWWFAPLRTADLRPWELGATVRDLRSLRGTLRTQVDGAQATVPDALLEAQRVRGASAGKLLLVLGGVLATVLFAFLAAAAAARTRDTEEELRRLAVSGASPGQLVALVVLESAAVATAGVLLGGALLLGFAAAGAAWRDVPLGELLGDGLAGAGAPALLAACWAAGVLVLAGQCAGLLPARWRLGVQVAFASTVLALLWSTASAGVDARRLARGDGVDPALVVLPGLLAALLVGLAVKGVPPLVRALERRAVRRGVDTQLALLSLARRPARTALQVSLVALGLAVALLAAGYRATLDRGLERAAAQATGAEVRVTGTASPAAARALAGAEPVLRAAAESAGTSGRLTLLGVGPAAWDDATAGARRPRGWPTAGPGTPPRVAGAGIPDGARALDLRLDVGRVRLDAALAFQRADGAFERLPIARERPQGRYRLRLPLEPRLGGSRLVALEVTVPLGAGNDGPVGRLAADDLAVVAADGTRRPLPGLDAWETTRDAALVRTPSGAGLRFQSQGNPGYLALRAPQPAARDLLPVITDPGTAREAGPSGEVGVTLPGSDPIRARVVGVRPRVATVSGAFVLADARSLYATANRAYPGSLQPRELWGALPAGAGPGAVRAALRETGVPASAVALRSEHLAASRRDWLVRGLRMALLVVIAVGLALAVGVPLLLAGAARRDERSAAAGLSRLGVGRRRLARQGRRATAIALAVAAGAGVVVGIVLVEVLADGVQVGADGRPAVPELQAAVPAAACAGILAAWLLASGVGLRLRRQGS